MIITDRIAGLNQGVALKAPCRVVTTAEIVLYGLQTINGVAVAAGDRVLVKDQSNTVHNGIWVASATAWARAKDFNGPRDAVKGTLVYAGAPNDGAFYSLQTPDPVMIGTDAITFIAFLFADPADVAALLAISADITTVAGVETDITAVSNIALDVTAVANLTTEVQAVAAAVADITACASALSDIQAAPQAAQDAADARDLAEKWAGEDEDVEVEAGKYSAYHWAQKALDAVIGGLEAADITYSNATSGLTATDVQGAIDEIVVNLGSVASGLGTMAAETAADYTPTSGLGSMAFEPAANYMPIAPRVQTAASGDLTPTADDDICIRTAQAAALVINNPTGTMQQGQAMLMRIKDDGTARAISYGSNYRALGTTLPTTTVLGKTLYLAMVWNATDTKFDVTGVAQEA